MSTKDEVKEVAETTNKSVFYKEAPKLEDLDNILLALKSSSKILYVVTNEEDRFIRELHSVIWDENHSFNEKRSNELWIWTAGNGLREITKHAAYLPYNIKYDETNTVKKIIEKYFQPYNKSELEVMKQTIMATPALNYIQEKLCAPPTVNNTVMDGDGKIKNLPKITYRTFIMADYHDIAKMDPTSVRKLKDLMYDMTANKYVKMNFIILANNQNIPPGLAPLTEVFDYSLPSRTQIETIVRKFVSNMNSKKLVTKQADGELKITYTEEEVKAIVDSCLGLSAYEINIQLNKSRNKMKSLDSQFIVKAKEGIIRKSDIINYIHPDVEMNAIGGMDNLKEWFKQRKESFTPEAKAFGLEAPKGVLMVGIPGTGKSLGAKALGHEWGVPLLHLDVGKVMSGIVGSSENRIREALKTAEAVAPCILWVDEIEKGFSGTGSSNMSDGGTMARVFGTFLTWMQEKKADVFVIATANNISQLPPELMRKGRFDEIFFVDLPGTAERKDIFKIHIGKRKQLNDKLDLDTLANETAGFSGAEIEHVVKDAMHTAFATKDKVLKTSQILAEIQKTIPLSKSMEDELKKVKDLATRMRFASDDSLNKELNSLKKDKKAKAKGHQAVEDLTDEPGQDPTEV